VVDLPGVLLDVAPDERELTKRPIVEAETRITPADVVFFFTAGGEKD
jgi:hypothetical protein